MKKFAVVVAGGSGQRMASAVPKQFLLLKGKPLLFYTVQTFLQSFDDVHVILVLPPAHLAEGTTLIAHMQVSDRVSLAAGGQTRFHSVQNGLAHVIHPSVVFVHDGVRCLVTTDLIQRCYMQAIATGSAVPVVGATDSLRMVSATGHQPINRDSIRIVQTPQTFLSDIICTAFKQAYDAAFTDEATVVEAAGHRVSLVEGEYANIKITRPIDLCIAEKLLEGTTA